MGYRSDVSITCDKPAFTELIKRLKKDKVSLEGFQISKVSSNLWLITIDSVKWYGYDGIQTTIQRWMDNCACQTDKLSGEAFHGSVHFIRIGEDIDDLEDAYFGDWLEDGVYVERYIVTPEDGAHVSIMCPWGYQDG